MNWLDKYEKDEYYLTEEGYIVFTEVYHLKRGYCCNSNCRHCPWKAKKNISSVNTDKGPPNKKNEDFN